MGPCSTRRSSRRTTSAASTARSSTRTAPTRSGAPTSSSSSRASIAVGRDMRISAPAMAAAVMEGAADGGADVRDLGMVGTEMVYFAVGELGLDGGICVTASHNPKEYTGHEDRPPAARCRSEATRGSTTSGRAPRPASARSRGAARSRRSTSGRVRRQGALVRRRRRDRAAADRHRRRERDGRRDAATGARAPAAGRGRPLLLRAGRHVPEPRAEPAARGEPRSSSSRRRARRAPTSASRTTATPTAASSSTTPASSSPATSSPRCSPR